MRSHSIRVLSSTEVLDLVDRQISSGGEMSSLRRLFHVGTIISGGEEKMFALAGSDDSYPFFNTVEEWVEASSTWKADAIVSSSKWNKNNMHIMLNMCNIQYRKSA